MGKLLRARDIFLLTLAGIGDFAQEVKDPLRIMAKSYEAMYGFIPKRYKRNNFFQTLNRSFKTGDIEKIAKGDRIYLRLTSIGKKRLCRDFPILNLTRKWDKRWLIVVFDISEKSKSTRNNFRRKLKNLGFGMLQESVWISPLSIGQDMREFVNSIGLSEDVFVMEISGFILGNPKQLARNIWHLDQLEEDYLHLQAKLRTLNQLIKTESDRINKNEAKRSKSKDHAKGHVKDYMNKLLKNKRELRKSNLEFLVNFPPLPSELLSGSLQTVFPILS
jgi:CRISPR-associated endonuclease Cas2